MATSADEGEAPEACSAKGVQPTQDILPVSGFSKPNIYNLSVSVCMKVIDLGCIDMHFWTDFAH